VNAEALGTIVVALGGNAIARSGDDGTIEAQYVRAREAARAIGGLIAAGARVVLTHGNGPVVGNIVLRGELASGSVPPTPLYIAGADSEGGIGLMLQQTLGNEMRKRGSARTVVSLVTQVVVDADDPAFGRPTKPIGSFYSPDEAAHMTAERGWVMAAQTDGRLRRVVPCPTPRRVVEVEAVRALLEAGEVPIAAGGGGVPVVELTDGSLAGIDAVIDKDWTGALLATQLDAQVLVLLMEADGVYESFGTPQARRIPSLNAAQVERMLAEGAFAEGSIAPKVAASAHFVRSSGRSAVLCRAEDLEAALEGRAGTLISA